jgi:hypothetical protein
MERFQSEVSVTNYPIRKGFAFFSKLWVALVMGALVLASTSEAHAQGKPAILRPSDRPWFFAAGIGPTFYAFNRGCGRYGFYYRGGRGYCSRTHFKLGLDIGYHFSKKFEGPAIGASIEQEFDDGFYFFNPAFKFWWDIEIADMAIYITPQAKVGYAMGSDWFRSSNFIHGFNIGAGVECRLVLHNRGLVFLRPIQIDTYIGDFGPYAGSGVDFVINWTILLGGGVVWD